MSDIKQHNDIFKNEKTRRRRAWVESALEGAKGNPQDGDLFPVSDIDEPQRETKRHLYVAYSSGRRRAGS
jgi:hypothetical protein